MIEQIAQILNGLGIDSVFQMNYAGKADKYAMYDVYSKVDADYQDDKATKIIHYITIGYRCKSMADISLDRNIKDAMIAAKFTADGITKWPDPNGKLFGWSLDFIGIEYIDEEQT